VKGDAYDDDHIKGLESFDEEASGVSDENTGQYNSNILIEL
jgi:hypothetical protein